MIVFQNKALQISCFLHCNLHGCRNVATRCFLVPPEYNHLQEFLQNISVFHPLSTFAVTEALRLSTGSSEFHTAGDLLCLHEIISFRIFIPIGSIYPLCLKQRKASPLLQRSGCMCPGSLFLFHLSPYLCGFLSSGGNPPFRRFFADLHLCFSSDRSTFWTSFVSFTSTADGNVRT